MILSQQSWALTYTGDPRAGESAAGRGLVIAEQAGDAAMTVWAQTALLVAVGRQGRFDEALAHARRAAARAADAHDIRSLPLQPKFFLGLALADCDLIDEARAAFREALDDEFGSGWWYSETLMADAQASFVTGDWDDAVPGLIAGGQAAQEKGNLLLVSQSLAYRAIIATGKGDHRAASELAAAIPLSPEGDELSYNAGILAFAVAGLKAAEGDRQGAYDVLLRCWRVDAARDNRFYHRWLAPDLVRLALTLGHRDVAAEVADTVAAGVALAPEVPTVRSLALRCQGLVDDAIEPLIEAVALARRAPLLIEHAGACEDAARVLAQAVGGRRRRCCWPRRWTATSRRARMPGHAGSGRSCGPSASVGLARIEAPARGRLGEPHRDRAGGVAAGGRGPDERRRCQAAVHLAAHRQHPPPARVRQAGRDEPGRACRRRTSRDRVMSRPPLARTLPPSTPATEVARWQPTGTKTSCGGSSRRC